MVFEEVMLWVTLSFSPVWIGALCVISLFLLSWGMHMISYAGNLSGAFHHGHKSFVLKHITSMEFLALRPKFVPLDGALLCFFWRECMWAMRRRKWGHPYSKHDSQNVWQPSVFGFFLSFLSTVCWGRQLASLWALLQILLLFSVQEYQN